MREEKEKYFLELAKEGAKLPPNYDVGTILIKEEETITSRLQKKILAMQE